MDTHTGTETYVRVRTQSGDKCVRLAIYKSAIAAITSSLFCK
jgi:hypothetical protein